jgi:dTDP-4-dehydrorhamnose reductase
VTRWLVTGAGGMLARDLVPVLAEYRALAIEDCDAALDERAQTLPPSP